MTCLMSRICAKADGCDIHVGTNIEKCSAFKEKQTNFQRITSSPEALAKFIAWQLSQLNDIHECDIPIDADDNLFKKEFWLEWLKQESE